MKPTLYDFVIVGAGFTGLNTAKKLKNSYPHSQILILEKSKSCGGRMATRRIDEIKFDHGAQFIECSEESKSIIQEWRSQRLIKDFPLANKTIAFCATNGITTLAKALAQNLDIKYETKVSSIRLYDECYILNTEEGAEFSAKKIILTAPLPQNLSLLKSSNFSFDGALEKIEFSKAIVFLLKGKLNLKLKENYIDSNYEGILTLTDQKFKGNSATPAWTIVMTDDWSTNYFEKSDSDTLEAGKKVLFKAFESLQIESIALKKWRFAIPKTTWRSLFYQVYRQHIYLTGDAFGGPNLLGAIRSSNAVWQALLKDKMNQFD